MEPVDPAQVVGHFRGDLAEGLVVEVAAHHDGLDAGIGQVVDGGYQSAGLL